MILELGSLTLGLMSGYMYGLSLTHQGKALSFSYGTSLYRMIGIALLGYIVLQYGKIPFILFIGSLIITKWIVILTQSE